MPELPEVEGLCRDLSRALPGRSIAEFDLRLPKVFHPSPGLGPVDLVGATFETVRRRAKMLVFRLSKDLSVVTHLRLSGQLVLVKGGEVLVAGGHPVPGFGAPLPHKSTHAIFTLDDDSRLYYTDIRQFGFLALMPSGDVSAFLAGQDLGLEPLQPEFTQDALAALLTARRRARLKPLLLDQAGVAGLGNIYADESLWWARLHPLRLAGSLSAEEVARLHAAILAVLDYALTHGVARVIGTRADPSRDFPHAHGREGKACPRCGTTVERFRLGGRSTYYCPNCQPDPSTREGSEQG